MTRPLDNCQNHVALLPHRVGALMRWGGLILLAGLTVSLSLTLGTATETQAQTTKSSNFPTGVDIIPTDLPAHASEPVLSNRPRSLLPGAIPVDDTIEGNTEMPSLATQYYQTLTGTAPTRPEHAAPDTRTPASTKPRTHVTTAPAASPNAITVVRTETATLEQDFLPSNPNGKYLIQLGAFRDTISAESYWASFLVRYPTLSKTHDKQLVVANLGEKGVFHRLQLTGFTDFETAKQQCRRLKADGTDCFATHH